MGNKYLLLFLFFLQSLLPAQTPGALWIKTFTGEGSEYGWSVIETSDNYYLMTGTAYNKLIFIKTDTSGNVIWNKTFNSSYPGERISLVETSSHYFLAAAEKFSLSRMSDAWLLMFDSEGDTLWTKTYGTEASDHINCLIETADGFLLAGETSDSTGIRKSWIIKISNSGEVQWEKVIESDFNNGIYASAGNDDAGYLLTGYIFINQDNLDSYVVKVDISGNIEWSKTYGNTDWEQATSVQSLDDGFIVLSLVENTAAYSKSVWLKRLTGNGDTLWTKKLGESPGLNGGFVQLTTDNSFLISANPDPAGSNNSHIYLAKLDQQGSLLWSGTYGNGKIMNCSPPVETSGDNYLISGTRFLSENNTDILLVKTGPDPSLRTRIVEFFAETSGRIVELTWVTSHQKNCRGFQVERRERNQWVTISFIEGEGSTNNQHQYRYTDTIFNAGATLGYRIQIINFDGSSDYSAELETTVAFNNFDLLQNYPNPFNSITNIEFSLPSSGYTNLSIYNILGEEIIVLFNQEADAGYYKFKWNAAEFPVGVYICRLTSSGSSITKKLVHLK